MFTSSLGKVKELRERVYRFAAGIVLMKQAIPLMRLDIILSSFTINVLMLSFPLVVLQVYDRILPNEAMNTLLLLAIGVIIALLLDIVLKTARGYVAGWAGANFEHRLGVTGIKRLLGADISQFEADSPGKHLDRLAGVDMVKDFYSSQASLVLVDMPFILVFVAAIAYIGGILAVVPVILLVIFIYVALRTGEDLRHALETRLESDNRRYSFIIETLSGIHTIKSCAMESLFERRYERIMAGCSESGLKASYLSGLAQNLGSMFSQITMVSVVSAGSLLVIDGSLTVGGLAACMLLSGRTVSPILRAMGVWSRFQLIQVAEDNLNDLSRFVPAEIKSNRIEEPLKTIELDDVSFRYGDDLPLILQNISLTMSRGQIIGIRGSNGAGKTTLLQLMVGGLAPTKGRVLYNNYPAEDIDARYLKSQIAYLPQRPVLFEGSVLDNITMFRTNELLDEALEISERLGLDKVFARYPDGYETAVGATAYSTLPGGVGQRIAIARALLGQPRFVLFDEANTGLDGPGDARIKAALKQFQETAAIVIVTYRPSLLAIADERFDLVDGALWPSDSFSEKLREKNTDKE